MEHQQKRTWKNQLRYTGAWFLFFGTGVLFSQLRYQPLQLTYDSHDYIAASDNISTYFTRKNADQVPYLHRPPLLPAYLHFFPDKIAAAKWLNIFCFATSLFLSFRIAGELQMTKFFLYALIIVIAFNYPWLQNHFFMD